MVDELAEQGYQPELDARELRRPIKTDIENLLARKLLAGTIVEGSVIDVAYGKQGSYTISDIKLKKQKTAKAKKS